MTVKPRASGVGAQFDYWEWVIRLRFAIILILILSAVGFGYYKWIYRPAHLPVIETDYVISPSLDVLNTYAPVHMVVNVLKAGDRVEIVKRAHDWAEIRLSAGKTGWVLASQLIGPQTFAAGKQLLQRVSGEQAQAAGHTSGIVNLHVEPSREGALLTVLQPQEKVEMYDRKLVPRGATVAGSSEPAAGKSPEAWYLVQAQSPPRSAGWVLGRLITLDIPPAISQYAQAYNLVAWRTLTVVDDNGQQFPEYVVADRVGSQEVDFNHIRVFTWAVAQDHYVTAFVESGLRGQFPITSGQAGDVPYFALRLTDKDGKKYQKFYGLYDTIVRPLGTVAGWQPQAGPPAGHGRRARRGSGRR